MAKPIGIDFGTTNSLISVIQSGKVKSFLDAGDMPYPSTVGFDAGRVIVGKEARELISDRSSAFSNNYIRSPKVTLGNGPVFVNGHEMLPATIVHHLMKYLKEQAMSQEKKHLKEKEQAMSSDMGSDPGTDFSKAVVSIPVAMAGQARKELRDAMLQAGIRTLQFVHEPLAALYGHLKLQDNLEDVIRLYKGKLLLVFDWGGGTLDLTLCQILNGVITQVMNVGDNEVGGDYIDELIKSRALEAYATQHNISERLEVNPGAEAKLILACEEAKIALSESKKEKILVFDYYLTKDFDPDIDFDISRDELNAISKVIVERGLRKIADLLEKLDIDSRRIGLCLATGGMVKMPIIKNSLEQMFGLDRLEVSKKGDRIISEGCAWIANDGLRMALAKPFEVVESRQSYLSIFKSGTKLPQIGSFIKTSVGMYCVDPRDGKAKFQFVRPTQANKMGAADPRKYYDNLVVNVDSDADPFLERIVVDCTIDDNYIVTIKAYSELMKDSDSCEIYDIEFSLELGDYGITNDESQERLDESDVTESGRVRVRSNVVSNDNAKEAIPGEVLSVSDPSAFYIDSYGHCRSATEIQVKEKLYYAPCALCGRRSNDSSCNCSSGRVY